MKDLSFLEFVISSENHILISADARAYTIIKSDTYTPFEEYIDTEYRDIFLKKLSEADGSWFPIKIISDDKDSLYYAKITVLTNKKMCKLTLVSFSDLLESHTELSRTLASCNAQLELYDDIFFEYDPITCTIQVFNAPNARFNTGIYPADKLEEILCENTNQRQSANIRNFFGQMKSKTGRFSARIDANIINDISGYNTTLLEGAYVYYDEESEFMVGHIHLTSSKGKVVQSSIKHDSLTGLVDKSDIMRIGQERINERHLKGTTIAIIDIDFFKSINDTYGHQFGDTVIKQIADIISTEVGTNGIVGRFGGDEFLVIFYNISQENTLRSYLRSIKNMVSATFSDKGIDENTPLSVSIGAAGYPEDADNYEDIFMLADYCLYVAKEKGRNRYVIYTESKHGNIESIRLKSMTTKKINERGELSYGDMLIKMYDITLHGSGSTPELLMDEFSETFELQHVALYAGTPFISRYSTGIDAIRDRNAMDFMLSILNSDIKDRYIADRNFIVVNRIESLPPQASSIKDFLKEVGVMSYVLIKFYDKDGCECIMIISSINKYVQWNQMHFKYYRAFADLLSKYSIRKIQE